MVRRDRNHACAILWEAQLNETAQVTEEYCRKLNAIVHQEYPGDQCFTAGDPAYGNEGGKVFDVAYGRERVPGKPAWSTIGALIPCRTIPLRSICSGFPSSITICSRASGRPT